MADPQIETPMRSGATDAPDAPQTQGVPPSAAPAAPVTSAATPAANIAATPAANLAPLESMMANAAGDKIGYDSTQKKWVDATTRKPYVAPPQELSEHPALPKQVISAADMVKNSKTGQMLAYDQSQKQWVDVVTRHPYTPTPAPTTAQAAPVDQNSNDIPLTSYGAATRAGFNSVANATLDAVKGAVSSFNPKPQDESETQALKVSGIGGMLAYRMLSGMGHAAQPLMHPTDIAAMIHDINQSKDPMGTYLKIAQQTAAMGGGQALTAIAGEGVAHAGPAAIRAMKGAASGVGDAAANAISSTLRPTTEEVGATSVPVRNPGGVAKILQQSIPEKLKQFAEEHTGPAVAKGIGDVVKNAVGTEGETLPTQTDRMGIIGHADEVKAASQGTFQKLDQLSGNMLSDAQKAAEDAYGDFSKEGRAEYRYQMQLQDMIFDEYKNHPEFKGIDLDQAKTAWRQQVALRVMNKALSTATEASPTGLTDYQFKQGPQLSTAIDNLVKNDRDVLGRAGLTEEHIDQLQKFGRIIREQGTAPVSRFGNYMSGVAKVVSAMTGGLTGGLGGAVGGVLAETAAEKLGGFMTDKLLGKTLITPKALETLSEGFKKGIDPAVTVQSLKADIAKTDPTWWDKLVASAKSINTGGEEGAAGNVTKRVAGQPGTPSLVGKRGVKAPNYVYRARDVGETGIPLQDTHAQATSDPAQAAKYAEAGQRGPAQGEVVKVDLNKLSPKDYEVKQHPDGMNWVKFKRAIDESEVEPHNPAAPVAGAGGTIKALASQADDVALAATKKNEPGRTEGVPVLPTEKVGGTRISQRNPTAIKATENPINEDLQVGMDAIKKSDESKPGFVSKLAATVAKYPGVPISEEIAQVAPERALTQFVNHISDNLVWLHNQIPENVRNISKLWYDSAHELTKQWAAKYGVTHEQMAGAVASLSPQNEWNNNVEVANRVADILKNKQNFAWSPEMQTKASQLAQRSPDLGKVMPDIMGKSLKDLDNAYDKAAWIRVYDESHNGRTMPNYAPDGSIRGLARNPVSNQPTVSHWNSTNGIAKAVSILEDGSKENIHTQLGEMHKVRNFYNNIIDPWSKSGDVTIDTHAVGAGHLRPMGGSSEEVMHNFGSSFKPTPAQAAAGMKASSSQASAVTGVQGTYGLYAEAYRQAAAKLGILPRELQSITWEGIRSLYESRAKTDELKSTISQIWKDHKNGEVSIDRARNQILKAAGGFKNPKWLSDIGQNAGEGSPVKP